MPPEPVFHITAPPAAGAQIGAMNRFLLVLNIVAAGSIVATNSAAVLAAISPYGSSGPVAHPVETAAVAAPRPDVAETASDTLAVKADPKLRLASVEAGTAE